MLNRPSGSRSCWMILPRQPTCTIGTGSPRVGLVGAGRPARSSRAGRSSRASCGHLPIAGSKMWSGRMTCGKSTTSGSGKSRQTPEKSDSLRIEIHIPSVPPPSFRDGPDARRRVRGRRLTRRGHGPLRMTLERRDPRPHASRPTSGRRCHAARSSSRPGHWTCALYFPERISARLPGASRDCPVASGGIRGDTDDGDMARARQSRPDPAAHARRVVEALRRRVPRSHLRPRPRGPVSVAGRDHPLGPVHRRPGQHGDARALPPLSRPRAASPRPTRPSWRP